MSDSEEKHKDSLYIVEIFETIKNKDEHALARVLEQSTIKSILMYITKYGISPLAYCILTGDVSHLGLVRSLLRSGLCDSEVVDSNGQTVLASLAHAPKVNLNFLERIIGIVIEGVDDTTACYKMLKHNSLELFKVFLAMKQYDERRLFESLTSAITKLNVKKFHLCTNLRMFVLWQLGDYGYKYLSGDCMRLRENKSNEWKDHVDVIGACWNRLAEKYDTGKYEDIDDRLLHELHVMHNHLYFLQHKQFLEYLPLQEAIFCLAVFINVFEQSPNFEVYRLMVHKCLVVEIVRMVSFQLVLVKKYLESAELNLTSMITEAESFVAPIKQELIEELTKRLDLLDVRIQQSYGRILSLKTSNSNKDAIIRNLLQRMKKVDKSWTEGKIKEIREKQRQHLIELLESRLERVVHPQNVADRIMARTKRNPSIEHSVIAADIVANALFDLEHLMRGKDRRIRRKLIRCYNQMKQLHSLNKIITTFGHVAKVNRANVEVLRDCLKRAVTVLGETMKNTKSTPNMPNGRLKEAMEQMLTERFVVMSILHRNNYARKFSFARLLIDGELERRVYKEFPNHTAIISMVLNLLFVIQLADVRRSFYGLLIRCGSLEHLRALFIWAGEKDPAFAMQHDAFHNVKKYFTNIKELFVELREKKVAKTVQFIDVDKQFIFQCSIVEQLEAMLMTETEFNFENLRKTCFSCKCLTTLRRILHWKLDSYHPNRLLETIRTKWDPNVEKLSHIQFLDNRLTWIDPTTVTSKLSMLLSGLSANKQVERHQLSRTNELIQTMKLMVVEDDAVLQLNEMLQPYYDNIFFLDNKWKVLESFCRQRQLPWDSTLAGELRRRDQEQLQTLFDERRSKLRSILEQNDIRTVDVLDVGVIILQKDISDSLEYLQLELCEILIAVGYFGDSFYYMKHRIPMIQGKNYRNLLAHDSLSYNLLTDSGGAKLVVNAFIFANTEVRLFDSRRNEPADLRFPSLEDTGRWVEEQQQLLAAIKTNNLKKVHEAMRAGGEIKSLFCSSANISHYPATCVSIAFHLYGICNPEPSIVALLGLYIPNISNLTRNSKFLLKSAIVRREFEAAFKFTNESELLHKEFYAWPNLISHILPKLFDIKTISERVEILHHFLDNGNEKCVEQMIEHLNDYIVIENEPDIVCKAILRGLRASVELLVRKARCLHPKSLELAIVMHWNDMLSDIAAKIDLDDSLYVTLLRTSIQVNNVTALVHFLNDQQTTKNALRECYLTASFLGRCTVLKYLLTNYPPMNHNVLATAIHNATLYNYWRCVQLLLDAGADVDVLIPGYEDAESNVLLLLVMYDQIRLIRQIKSVNRAIYGTLTEHPFSVALRNDTASVRMIRALSVLGFGWLDSSLTLHEVISQGYDQPAWNTMWREIDDQLVQYFPPASDHCTLHLIVLQRWKLIAFVEECNMDVTALGCAARMDDSSVLRTLLDRLCSMRQMNDVGVFGDIVFLSDTSIIRHCTREKHVHENIASCCEDMIRKINELRSITSDIQLQERTIVVGDVAIKFAVPAHVQVNEDAADVRFIDSSTLVESLHGLHEISNALFTTHPIVHAMFSKDDRTTFFLRIENLCCVYDMYAPGSRIDLSNILNAKAGGGDTVLMTAVKNKCDLEKLKSLIEMGANPLLSDDCGHTPIGLGIDYWSSEITLYLIDECLRRDLRSDDGANVLDVTDGTGENKIIHKAASNGHEEILAQLIQLQVDATVRNIYGCTPAHLVASIPLTNNIPMMKQLLNYDRTPVDMVDGRGATLLCLAAHADAIEMLDLLMEYNPDLTLQSNRAALYQAIKLQHVQWAKRFLHHAIEKGVPNVTSMEEDGDDVVIMSLTCADFELSRALLEYELGHPLEEITADDRPRIEAVLSASTLKIPQVPVKHLLELKGLNESENFLTFLRNLLKERFP